MVFQVTVSNRQRGSTLDSAWFRQLAQRLALATLDSLAARRPDHLRARQLTQMRERGSVSVIVVSNRRIRQLNARWRGKDAATDVISFPLELEAPQAELPWEVGEVVISLEKACEQARALGHSLERELSFLFLHGLLHILGFDHEQPDEEAEMLSRQREILTAAGISR